MRFSTEIKDSKWPLGGCVLMWPSGEKLLNSISGEVLAKQSSLKLMRPIQSSAAEGIAFLKTSDDEKKPVIDQLTIQS